jgi:putative ABC transport system substrate-binding protein
MPPTYKVVLTILCVIFPLCDSAAAIEKISPRVAIVVSQRIRPYLEAVEGLRGGLARDDEPEVDEFDLESFTGRGQDILARDLTAGRFDLFIAIGPSAARFVWARFPSQETRKLCTMVLGPEKELASAESVCSIALSVPVRTQLQILSCGLPSARRVGILYDPLWNTEFVKQAAEYSSEFGLKIVPLEVSSKKNIPIVLQQHWEGLDALLLIPDRTVISESLVKYIIKQAISEGVAVVGYNRFFYESGAALAFVFDYEEIGEQTARLALRILAGEGCKREDPIFHTWLNSRVIKTLGIQVAGDGCPGIEVGP